ncbi:MAG: MFS transporter [Proteobacteria bacterium]|nr:MAG: MFS transporter [Pseudomonadota bacterium]
MGGRRRSRPRTRYPEHRNGSIATRSGPWILPLNNPAESTRNPPSKRLLLLLVALTAAAPVALQIFLPALPALQNYFGVSTGVAQYTLTFSIVANAFATLGYGPLSDRFGRRPVLIGGLVLFVVGSFAAVAAQSIGTLVFARVLQAAGAASGMVLARAILRDLYDTEQAARAIAYLTMAMVVAPMIAPTIGAVLVDVLGWRSVFVALSLFALLLLAWSIKHLIETRPYDPRRRNGAGLVKGAALLAARPLFVSYTLQSTFAISMFFSFLAGAPYFMVNVLGRTATEYGLYFIMVSGSYMFGNFVSARLVRRVGIYRLIVTGCSLTLCGALTSAALMFSGVWAPLSLFAPVALAAIGNGLSIPNSMAGAMSINRDLAGTASGLLGFTQMLFSAIVSQWVGELQNGTPFPMVIFMSICAALSLIGFLLHKAIGR